MSKMGSARMPGLSWWCRWCGEGGRGGEGEGGAEDMAAMIMKSTLGERRGLFERGNRRTEEK
jgi:hypothetical protein